MHSTLRFPTTSRRSLALTFLAGVLVLAPLPAGAERRGTCQPAPISSSSVVGYAYVATPMNQGQTGVRAPFELDLRVEIGRDGRVRADGAIRIPDGPAAAALSPYVPMLVIAKNVVDASCADLGGDGRPGLARLEGGFRNAAGEPVYVILTVLAQDVDANGVYAVALQIGDATATGEARFEVVRERAPHKHKHKNRRSR